MSILSDWMGEVCADLELTGTVDPDAVTGPILDLARDVAHRVARPAAPLTAFLVGVAVGRLIEQGADPGVATREMTARTATAAQARLEAARPAQGDRPDQRSDPDRESGPEQPGSRA